MRTVPTMRIALNVNGRSLDVTCEPFDTLLTVLRREGYNGAKRVCESGECGACAVVVDGRAVDSCIMLAAQAGNCEITTVEGLGSLSNLTAVQAAFADNGSIQCGFCIPGMIVAASNFLESNPNPTEDEIRHVFVGNLCRCTGYVKPVEAVLAAVDTMRGSGHGN